MGDIVNRVFRSSDIVIGGLRFSPPKWLHTDYVWVYKVSGNSIVGRNIDSYTKSILEEYKPIGSDLYRVRVTSVRSKYGEYIEEEVLDKVSTESFYIISPRKERKVENINGIDHVYTKCELYHRSKVSLKVEGKYDNIENNYIKQGEKYLPLDTSIADIEFKYVKDIWRLDYTI